MIEEMEKLREEVAALKKDMKRVLSLLNQEDEPDYPRPEYPSLEAEKLCARNDKMRIPFMVNSTETGAELLFMDKTHRCRAMISIGEGDALLEFRNAKGNLIAQLSEAEDGSGQFCVCDAEGNPRAALRVNEFGGVVNVVDKQRKPQAVMLGTPSGGEIFAVNDHHNMGVKMVATEQGGMVTVHEPSGQVMAFLNANGDSGACTVYGPLGIPAVGILANDTGGAIVIHDAEGNNKAVLP